MARPKHVQEFIDKIKEPAVAVRLYYGVPVSVTIAQAALESGWGEHVKDNAYFGIKGTTAGGQSTTFTTQEEVDGERITIKARFRAYSSIMEAAMDYGHFLSTTPNYADAFNHTDDPAKFVDAIAKAHYATAHDYAKTLKSIINGFRLTEYDMVFTLKSLALPFLSPF